MSRDKQIDLSKGESGYDYVGEIVKSYWEQNYPVTVIVALQTSYDGINYAEMREVVSPWIEEDYTCDFLHDWWEGQEYIKVLWIKDIYDIKISDENRPKASDVAEEIFAEIEKLIIRRMIPDVALIDDRLIADIAELKKKHTEKENDE